MNEIMEAVMNTESNEKVKLKKPEVKETRS